MLEDYCEIDRYRAQNLLSFSQKWIRYFKNQPMISSYHTTKRAQLDTIRIARNLASVDNNRCNALQTAIENYRRLIAKTYMRTRFGRRYEHCRYREFKNLFKHAHISVIREKIEIKKLHEKIHHIEQNLMNTNNNFEKMADNQTMNGKKLMSISNIQSKYETELKRLKAKLVNAQEIYVNSKEVYRRKAKTIFLQCQQIEHQRLEQIREILLAFIQTMHIQNYVSDIEQIYNDLISSITMQQNSLEDLSFWAKTYGVDENYSLADPESNVDFKTSTNDVNRESEISISSTIDESSFNKSE